jgi:hypothetical protein
MQKSSGYGFGMGFAYYINQIINESEGGTWQ